MRQRTTAQQQTNRRQRIPKSELKQARAKALQQAKFEARQYKDFIRGEIEAGFPDAQNLLDQNLLFDLDDLTNNQLEILFEQTSQWNFSNKVRLALILLTLATIVRVSKTDMEFGDVVNSLTNLTPITNDLIVKAALIAGTMTPFNPVTRRQDFRTLTAAAAVSSSIPTAQAKPPSAIKISTNPAFVKFWNDCNTGNLQGVKKALEKLDEKEIKEMLLSVDDKHNVSALLMAVVQGQLPVVVEILKLTKPGLLRDVLMTPNKKGVGSLFMATIKNEIEITKKIIGAIKKDGKLVEDALLQKPTDGYCALETASEEMIKVIFEGIRDQKPVLRKILLSPKTGGDISIFIRSIILKNHVIIRAALETIKGDEALLRQTLMQKNQEGLNMLNHLISSGDIDLARDVINIVKDYPGLLKDLITGVTPITHSLPPLTYLLMAGDDKIIKTILLACPDLSLEKLPNTYYSNVCKTSVYHLEAMSKANLFKPKIGQVSYYQITPQNTLAKTDIDKLNLMGSKPVIVEVKGKRSVIGQNLTIELLQEKDRSAFKEMFQQANKHKIKNISVELSVTDNPNSPQHAFSMNFSQNPDGQWKASFFHLDENSARRFIPKIQKTALEIGVIIEDFVVMQTIIPNHSKPGSAIAYCDIIASATTASVAIGDWHIDRLEKFCEENGDDCIDTLGQKLNPHIDEILKQRFDRVKSQLLTKSPGNPSAKKVLTSHKEL